VGSFLGEGRVSESLLGLGNVQLASFQMLPTTSEHSFAEGACGFKIPCGTSPSEAVRNKLVLGEGQVRTHMIPKCAEFGRTEW